MDSKDLKKLLAGLGVAGLISTGGITLPGAHGASGWSAAPSAGSVEKEVEKPAAGSGWSATKESAVSAEEEIKKAAEGVEAEAEKKADEATEAVKEEVEKAVEKPSGSSGWSGSK